MDVLFADEKSARFFSSHPALQKRYGAKGAAKIAMRLQQLAAVPTLAHMRDLPGHCHALTGDRSGQFAVDVHQPHRLIFEPAVALVANGRSKVHDLWERVDSVKVIEVVDYH